MALSQTSTKGHRRAFSGGWSPTRRRRTIRQAARRAPTGASRQTSGRHLRDSGRMSGSDLHGDVGRHIHNRSLSNPVAVSRPAGLPGMIGKIWSGRQGARPGRANSCRGRCAERRPRPPAQDVRSELRRPGRWVDEPLGEPMARGQPSRGRNGATLLTLLTLDKPGVGLAAAG